MIDYSKFEVSTYLQYGDTYIGIECLDHPRAQLPDFLGAISLAELNRIADNHCYEYWNDHHAPDPTGMTCGMRCVEGHTYERGDCALAGRTFESANEPEERSE